MREFGGVHGDFITEARAEFTASTQHHTGFGVCMRVRRARMTWSERNELWKRWREGESVVDIARALARERTGVGRVITAGGGIAPRPRCRSPRVLSTTEREEISRGLADGQSLRALARRLGRAPS